MGQAAPPRRRHLRTVRIEWGANPENDAPQETDTAEGDYCAGYDSYRVQATIPNDPSERERWRAVARNEHGTAHGDTRYFPR